MIPGLPRSGKRERRPRGTGPLGAGKRWTVGTRRQPERSQARRPASIRRRETSVGGSTWKPRGRRVGPVTRAPVVCGRARAFRFLPICPRGCPSRPRGRDEETTMLTETERADEGNGSATRARAGATRLRCADRHAREQAQRLGRSRSTSTRSCARSAAAARACADVDAMRVATKTISGLYDGATTRELDQLSIQTAAALIAEEPQYAQARGAPARDLHRQGSPQPGDPRVLAVDRRRRSGSAWSTSASPTSSRATRASSTTRSSPSATASSSTSACARSTTATCCATRRRAS